MLKKDSLYIYLLFSSFFLSKSFNILSPSFSQNFGFPQDFPNFVKMDEAKRFLKGIPTQHPISAKYWIQALFISHFLLTSKGQCSLSRNFNKIMLQISAFNVFPLRNFSLQIPGGAIVPPVRGQGMLLGPNPPLYPPLATPEPPALLYFEFLLSDEGSHSRVGALVTTVFSTLIRVPGTPHPRPQWIKTTIFFDFLSLAIANGLKSIKNSVKFENILFSNTEQIFFLTFFC